MSEDIRRLERYIAFYTEPSFWAGKAIDPQVAVMPKSTPSMADLMSECVFSRTCDQYTLRVCRDGMLMLRMPSLEKSLDFSSIEAQIECLVSAWRAYLDFVNCLYLLLESCVLQLMKVAFFNLEPVTRHSAYRITLEDGKYLGGGQGQTNSSIDSLTVRFLGSSPTARFMAITTRNVEINESVFDELDRQFSEVVSDDELRKNLSNIAKSVGEYKNGNYELSVVLAWFVIEPILNQKWQMFVKSQVLASDRERFSKRRRESLSDSNRFTASVISNVLELAGALPSGTFRRIDGVRDHRNKIVHKNPKYACTPEDCKQAIELALDLATEGKSLHVQANYSYRVSGP